MHQRIISVFKSSGSGTFPHLLNLDDKLLVQIPVSGWRRILFTKQLLNHCKHVIIILRILAIPVSLEGSMPRSRVYR